MPQHGGTAGVVAAQINFGGLQMPLLPTLSFLDTAHCHNQTQEHATRGRSSRDSCLMDLPHPSSNPLHQAGRLIATCGLAPVASLEMHVSNLRQQTRGWGHSFRWLPSQCGRCCAQFGAAKSPVRWPVAFWSCVRASVSRKAREGMRASKWGTLAAALCWVSGAEVALPHELNSVGPLLSTPRRRK